MYSVFRFSGIVFVKRYTIRVSAVLENLEKLEKDFHVLNHGTLHNGTSTLDAVIRF